MQASSQAPRPAHVLVSSEATDMLRLDGTWCPQAIVSLHGESTTMGRRSDAKQAGARLGKNQQDTCEQWLMMWIHQNKENHCPRTKTGFDGVPKVKNNLVLKI